MNSAPKVNKVKRGETGTYGPSLLYWPKVPVSSTPPYFMDFIDYETGSYGHIGEEGWNRQLRSIKYLMNSAPTVYKVRRKETSTYGL